ncbi:Septin-domain-containing protein [Zopfochytrium polystomum]|nr:Septin-domain-containing protein [Zopfochytrium polystomum]
MSEREKQEYAKARLRSINAGREGREKVASNIGALKILVGGDSGIGKTSLIEAFFSSTEVVDKDPIPPVDGIPTIKELRASTILPSELHTGEEPFNLTFVDTPGFGSFLDANMIIKPIVDYHVTQFRQTDKIFAKKTAIPNLVKFLNSGTGCHSHTDVCLYGILHRLKPVDLEFMRQLSSYVSIVPVLLKGDTVRPRDAFALKVSILEELVKNKIPVYGFGMSMEELIDLAKSETPGGIPFVVASTKAAPPGSLAGAVNEFEVLKRAVFFSHIDDLREISAERFVSWRSKNGSR